MARSPLRLVDDTYSADEFDDLIASDDAKEEVLDEVESLFDDEDGPIDLEDAVTVLKRLIEDAVEFMNSEILPEWEDAEAFYDGESNVKKQKGRSQVTKTVVRDTVRAVKPSIMRVFLQGGDIVEYEPAEPLLAEASLVAMQQTRYNNQLFWKSGGYQFLYNAAHNAMLKKVGIGKACYSKTYKDEYMVLSNVTPEQLDALVQMDDVRIVGIEEKVSKKKIPVNNQNPQQNMPPEVMLRVEVVMRKTEGKISLDHVPLLGFFVDDGATCPEDATVIGQREEVTVSYARSIGLEYDDWSSLTGFDPEDNEASGESAIRRGYTKSMDREVKLDPSQHKFLLTEAYAKFDLDGTGIAQLYRFWLGGMDYEYIDHERVSENPYGVVQCDPMPDAFFGRSFYDILAEDQNTQTSLLRATCDNAHLANNVRLGVHETLVNMNDVTNPALGSPIRFRSPGMIQEIGVQPMVGAMLPLMQYLDMNSQTKVGVTDAAMGLDPDSLQSTDKEAVQNTIQLSQGQVELIARNMAETGIRPLFTKLLKLSLRHNPRKQVIQVNGTYVPVDQYWFNPDLTMKTNVGLGTGNSMGVIGALQMIAAKQQEVISQFGLNNPICGLDKMFNTVVDMGSRMGIPNMGRYFNQVTPEVMQQLDQQMQQAAQQQQQDQGAMAVIEAENIRAKSKLEEQGMENERMTQKLNRDTRTKMIELMMNDDLKRDQMAQDRAIKNAEITGRRVNEAFVEFEQGRDRAHDLQKFLLQQAQQLEQFYEQQKMQKAQFEAQQAQAAQQQAAPGGSPSAGGGGGGSPAPAG